MILIIDDDIAIRTSLKLLLNKAGHRTHQCDTPEKALDWVRGNMPKAILLDLNFGARTSGEQGMELLQKLKIFCPDTPVLLITAWGSIDLAVQGMKLGAFDFITKPWKNHQLVQSINNALEIAKLRKTEKQEEKSQVESLKNYDFSNIITQSEEMIDILKLIGRISQTDAPVLITGESGTGKELVAEALHNNSKRKQKPFVKVNLGGISASLFESEMFGHKKGAFTDAHTDRMGRFEMAEGGTIFLDEIGELELSSQVKLLRVLQEQSYEVLGDSTTRQANIRVVCATNKNLPEMVGKGLFREDLFYRINLIQVTLPPLRKRVTDIPLLARHFVKKTCATQQLPEPTLSKEAISHLKKLNFAGNIRELKNMVERSVLLCTGDEITEESFQPTPSSPSIEGQIKPGLVTLDEMEAILIRQTMESFNGNISKVARSLGLSRGALYRRLEKFGIPYEKGQ